MEDLTKAIIVHTLVGHQIVVEAASNWQPNTLGPLGFHPAPHLGANLWARGVENETDRLYLIRELLGWGALFAEGAGWSPNEVLEQLFADQKIDFAWRSVYWTGPGQAHIRTLPRTFPRGPSIRGTPEGKACAVCRERMRHPLDEQARLGSSAYRHASLYRCLLCGAWWEAGDRFANQLTQAQAAEFYPRGYTQGLQQTAADPAAILKPK